MVLKGLLPT